MRRLLSQARFLTLLLPLYCIFACVQVGCGGKVLHDQPSAEPIIGDPVDEVPRCSTDVGYGGYGGYGGGCDDNGYGGYDDGYYGYP